MSGAAFKSSRFENMPMKLLTIEECQALAPPLRDELELFDYEVRSALTRILADVEASEADSVLFLRASMTVLLSIAAGMLARAAEEKNAPLDVGSFALGAQKAVEWARTRRLRYFVGGEA